MDLDLNKFRTLIPIHALYENNLMLLAKQSETRKLEKGYIVSDKVMKTRILFSC